MTLKIKIGGVFTDLSGGGVVSGVDSFAGRTGAVVPQQNDYSVAQINGLSDALSSKQNALPTNGTPVQFLAGDFTWKTVSQGSPSWGSITGQINQQTDLTALLSQKVNVVQGKQLSTNDYTTVEKEKLAAISVNATANRSDADTDQVIQNAVSGLSTTPFKLATYLTADVPDASEYTDCIILIDDGNSKVLSISDGTSWVSVI